MPVQANPSVAIYLPTELYYSREVLHGIFDYVHKHRPWRYVTGLADGKWPAEKGFHLQGGVGMFSAGKLMEQFRKRKVPTVNISEKQSGVGLARVLPDNEEAGRVAAEYFLEKKFTHFAFSGCDDFAFSRLRGIGFTGRLADAGHRCLTQNFGDGKWPAHSMDPLPEIGEWLESLPKPCAVFAYADDHARRILGECERLDLAVPEEVAVLGCDNDEIQCELAPMPISSVAFPLRRIGYEAASALQALMDGSAAPPGVLRLPPTGIVTRHSTDIIAVKDMAVARAVRFISAHASDSIDVGDVVKACGASRRYLERRFNMLLGRTPKQEIQRKRLSIAKRLLAETLHPMPEIAEACGFSDAKMLSSVFRADVGFTPSEFRRRVRAKTQQGE
jgi:LacI family transcriptional regulator